MSTLINLTAKALVDDLKTGAATLVDIREADEYGREHIKGAISLPLSTLETSGLDIEPGQKTVFHCKSGMRTQSNCDRLAAHVDGDAYMLEGGLDAWKAAGLPTEVDKRAPLEIMRQVQITAGVLILAGVLLGVLVDRNFLWLAAFVGAGLTYAGASGWCGMAKLLSIMPWNRPQAV